HSRDHPLRVDGLWKGFHYVRARRIEGGDNTIGGAHVGVNYTARIGVGPYNRSCRVDAGGDGAWADRARNIDRGDSALGSTHEAVSHIVGVKVLSHDQPSRVDATVQSHKVPMEPGGSNSVIVPSLARTKP